MSTPLRPQYFCSRPNGTITPLVAVDELPTHVSLRGVPRVMTPGDTQGMTSLGTVAPRAQTYVVDMVPVSQSPPRHARDYELQSSLSRLMSEDGIHANPRLTLHALTQPAQVQQHTWAVSNPPANGWVVPGVNAAGAGGQKSVNLNLKKEYCSYWIRHGECDYQQQGCLYKHEMPTDLAMLEKLGLRDIPRWYREKYNVPSLVPHGNRSQVNGHWRDDAGVKAVQYPSRLGINGGFHPAESDRAQKQRVPTYHGGVIPDQPRVYTAMNAPKGPMVQKNGYKQINNQPKASGGKVDLLSFDPLDYASHDQTAGTMGELAYPITTTAESAISLEAHAQAQAQAHAGADRIHREDVLRNLNLPSLIPSSLPPYSMERSQTPIDATPCPVRPKRTIQQSRRLFQQRVGGATEAGEHWSVKAFRNHVPVVSSKAGGSQFMHIGSNSSPTVRGGSVGGNGGGSTMSSDPPTGPASPENQSHSSRSSHSSSHAYPHGKENEHRLHHNQQVFSHPPGAIGSKPRVQRKESSIADDDLFGLGEGRK